MYNANVWNRMFLCIHIDTLNFEGLTDHPQTYDEIIYIYIYIYI
jgi:hypothetical protein